MNMHRFKREEATAESPSGSLENSTRKEVGLEDAISQLPPAGSLPGKVS